MSSGLFCSRNFLNDIYEIFVSGNGEAGYGEVLQ